MGTQRVRPGPGSSRVFLVLSLLRSTVCILTFLLVILIEERRKLGLDTYSLAARKNKSDAGS
jgi:hypothetical protein